MDAPLNTPVANHAEMPDPRAARRAVRLIFIVCGLVTAGWAPMVPFAKDRLMLDDATLGMIVLCLGVGALTAMPLTGALMLRWGSRSMMVAGGLLGSLILPLLAVAPSAWLLAVALFFYGAFLATMDVSMNAHAVVVEIRSRRPVMSSFHAMFSIGGLLGAAGMSVLLLLGMPLLWAGVVMSAAGVAIVALQFPALLPREADMRSTASGGLHLPQGPAIIVGLLAMICFLAEGAMLDWSAVFLRFERGMDGATAGLGFAAFSVAMAIIRLVGDRLTSRLGPVNILLYGPIVAMLGLLVAFYAPYDVLALSGFAIFGVGVANVVPVLISTAGRLPNPAVNVPAVMILGYSGMLAGPGLIGLVAEQTSLTFSLTGMAVLLLVISLKSGLARVK